MLYRVGFEATNTQRLRKRLGDRLNHNAIRAVNQSINKSKAYMVIL